MNLTEREEELMAFAAWVTYYIVTRYRGKLFTSKIFTRAELEWLYNETVEEEMVIAHGNPYSPKDWGLSAIISTDKGVE